MNINFVNFAPFRQPYFATLQLAMSDTSRSILPKKFSQVIASFIPVSRAANGDGIFCNISVLSRIILEAILQLTGR